MGTVQKPLPKINQKKTSLNNKIQTIAKAETAINVKQPTFQPEIKASPENIIKIMGENFSSTGQLPNQQKIEDPVEEKIVSEEKREMGHILELINKFPELGNQKITNSSIRLTSAPFSTTPTLSNWIDFYYKECGKGNHSVQNRDDFIERIKMSQSLSPEEIKNLSLIFKSLDEKTFLPYDNLKKQILFDKIAVGTKLKNV